MTSNPETVADLVARLRITAATEPGPEDGQTRSILSEAASTLTSLEAERERLVGLLREAMSLGNLHYILRIKGQNEAYCDAVNRMNAALTPEPKP